ncbi:hypothetical protein [Flavobacterium sp. 25HG05S-40]|uniref:hypothetical protein n=1 Tax=Flavobacterium sp. 25HG05S-40 TaxID=3458682 RepID=UPI004043C45C
MNQKLLFQPTKHKKILYLLLGFLFISAQTALATTYYINDISTKGDIYTTTIGVDSNDGITASSPKISITEVYKIASDGDTIIIDSGNYKELTSDGKLLFENNKKIVFIIAGSSDKVFSKIPLPTHLKVNPTEIYIDQDKPTDRESYLKKIRLNQNRKSE